MPAPVPVLVPPLFVLVVLPADAPLAPEVPDEVAPGVGVDGTEVTGVGTSGMGLESTFATNSVMLASVAPLFRYL